MKPRQRGQDDFIRNERCENPYRRGSVHHREWDAGWCAAYLFHLGRPAIDYDTWWKFSDETNAGRPSGNWGDGLARAFSAQFARDMNALGGPVRADQKGYDPNVVRHLPLWKRLLIAWRN